MFLGCVGFIYCGDVGWLLYVSYLMLFDFVIGVWMFGGGLLKLMCGV